MSRYCFTTAHQVNLSELEKEGYKPWIQSLLLNATFSNNLKQLLDRLVESPLAKGLYSVHAVGLFLCCVSSCAHSLSRVQLFVTPMDCSPPGSSVHGTSQARILEWVAISYSRGSS